MTMQNSNNRSALGKGLSALISQAGYEDDANQHYNISDLVDIDLIVSNPDQPRKRFAEDEIFELKESIRQFGILQPILLRKKVDEDKYEIIAGERRWRACKALGLSEIPAIIKNLSDQETFEIALVENIQRENLTPLEEAQALEKMIRDYTYTHESLAKKIGKSRSYVTNMLRLLSLPDVVKNSLNFGGLSMGHAKAIANLNNPEELAAKIIAENWSVRKTESEVRKLQRPNLEFQHKKIIKGHNSNATKDTDLLEIEKMLSDALSLPVRINDTDKGGEVVIEFSCLEHLDGLIQRLANPSLRVA